MRKTVLPAEKLIDSRFAARDSRRKVSSATITWMPVQRLQRRHEGANWSEI
jgi:hypothetical protein